MLAEIKLRGFSAIILFGATARGESYPQSDYDFPVIAENLPRDFWAHQALLW